MNVDEIASRIAAVQPKLQAKGVRHLALFGSRVRGNARPDSDLDILLDVPNGHPFTLLDLIEVGDIVSQSTGIPANAFMRRSLEPDFLGSIEKDIRKVF